VLLLLAGFGLFLLGFFIYSHYLGSIDGLPQLGYEKLPDSDPNGSAPPPIRPYKADELLAKAFGARDDIQKMPIKLEVNSKNLVLASQEFEILPDGRARLTPFYLAIFGKDTPEGKFPEINTIKGDVAFLTFDQPVKSITDMSSRKIVAGELTGNIVVENNRRTPQRDDDLSMTTPGPLYYREDQHLIWTMAPVKMLDTQTKPEPTKIDADGMDLVLTTEKPEDRQAAAAPARPAKHAKKETVNGVDSITLRSNVRMFLIDSGSGFLASNDKSKKDKAADKPGTAVASAVDEKGNKISKTEPPPKPSKIFIYTQGPFRYDVPTDHARFDIPSKRGNLPEKVSVTRLSESADGQPRQDTLLCDHLDLQFQRKSDATTPEQGDHQMNLAIQNAHATGRDLGVKLRSEAEDLHAIGDDFFYDTATKESILKGEPEMIAFKEGHEIHAAELHIVNAGEKDNQQAKAKGKGYVALLDKATGKRNHYAYWKEAAYFTKEGDFDCLTLTTGARFEDREHNQQLGADRLKVWLQPAGKDKPAPPPAAPINEPQKMRPHHLEGTGHVFAISPEMHIVEPTEHLMVWFRDVPATEAVESQTTALDAVQPGAVITPPSQPPPGDHRASKPVGVQPRQPTPSTQGARPARDPYAPPAIGRPGNNPAPAAPAAPEKPKPPLTLNARDVECFVRRTGEKNDVERVRCNGDVHVHQDPEDPEDKPVDITGSGLQLNQYPDGGVLVVTGNMAIVKLNKTTIAGDEVNINQRTNEAWVPGRGWMKMLSSSTLAELGGNEDKPKPAPAPKKQEKPSELTIQWAHDMFFDGSHALFNGGEHGGVQATQEHSRLTCIDMRVFLDHPVSLKKGQPRKPGEPSKPGDDNQPAKVKKLLCDRSVRMEDLVLDKDGKLVRKSRLLAPVLGLDNEDGEANASGPGIVYLLQYGSEDDLSGTGGSTPQTTQRPPTNARPGTASGTANGTANARPGTTNGTASGAQNGTPAPAPELKLTRIAYHDRLYSNNNKRTATFYGGVEVINLPTENMDVVVDLDKLPKGCLHMKCEQMKVFSHKLPDGRSAQEMEAMRHVVVRSQEFWGTGDKVKYDESKDLVILEGGEGGKATLYRERAQGTEPDKLRGTRIFYWRKKNEFKVENGDAIKFQ
jgi:lipopolysaccharide export system protein LptA